MKGVDVRVKVGPKVFNSSCFSFPFVGSTILITIKCFLNLGEQLPLVCLIGMLFQARVAQANLLKTTIDYVKGCHFFRNEENSLPSR